LAFVDESIPSLVTVCLRRCCTPVLLAQPGFRPGQWGRIYNALVKVALDRFSKPGSCRRNRSAEYHGFLMAADALRQAYWEAQDPRSTSPPRPCIAAHDLALPQVIAAAKSGAAPMPTDRPSLSHSDVITSGRARRNAAAFVRTRAAGFRNGGRPVPAAHLAASAANDRLGVLKHLGGPRRLLPRDACLICLRDGTGNAAAVWEGLVPPTDPAPAL
jgi:hypothetical protein